MTTIAARIVIGVGFVLLVGLAAVYLTRPPTRVVSEARPDVTIECSATTGAGAHTCLAWGDAIVDQGPPSFTFEWDALSRLEIDRPLLGLGSSCEVAYFTPRYPDDPVWTEEIACDETR